MQYFTSVHLEQACVAIVEQLHLWESLVMHLRVKVSKWHYFATWMISISPADLNMRLAVKAKPVNHKQLEKRCCLSWAEETCRARSVLIFRGRKERTRSSSKLFCCSHVYWAGQGYFIESCNDPYKCSSSKKIAIIVTCIQSLTLSWTSRGTWVVTIWCTCKFSPFIQVYPFKCFLLWKGM